MLDDGRELRARWVLGADGQRSSVAHHLGLERVEERRGELAMLLGYWRGLPASDWIRLDMHERSAFMAAPCEDGLHLLTVAGPPDLTRGTPAALEARYRQALLDFPAVLNPRLLAAAELVSPVVGAPETMMRGYYRSAAGPGWALVGDAGHFKHPTTGQGIGDALAQAEYVALDLLGGGDLAGYERWRAERSDRGLRVLLPRCATARAAQRAAGTPGWPRTRSPASSSWTRSPADPAVRRVHPRAVPALAGRGGVRGRPAPPGHAGRRLSRTEDLQTRVPACPLWSVHDLVAHLCGVAEDSTRGQFFDGAAQAWADCRARRAAGGLDGRAGRGPPWPRSAPARRRAGAARTGTGPRPAPGRHRRHRRPCLDARGAGRRSRGPPRRPARGARAAPEPEALITRYGFGSYRAWLGERIAVRGLAPLRLTDHADPASAWVLGGDGEPGATLEADAYELFRAISGRRRLEDVRSWSWRGDPSPYLSIALALPAVMTALDTAPAPTPRAGTGTARARAAIAVAAHRADPPGRRQRGLDDRERPHDGRHPVAGADHDG